MRYLIFNVCLRAKIKKRLRERNKLSAIQLVKVKQTVYRKLLKIGSLYNAIAEI